MKKLVITYKRGFDWISSIIFIVLAVFLLITGITLINVMVFLLVMGFNGFNWFRRNKTYELNIECEDYKEIK